MQVLKHQFPNISKYEESQREDIEKILPADIKCGQIVGLPPLITESRQESYERFNIASQEAITRSKTEGTTIVLVTHGDCVNTVGTKHGSSVVPVPPCGWIKVSDEGLIAGGGDDPAVLLGFALD